ncbi:MAG: hypothetical protein CUN55_05600 [Phototrophicales bacterium]|nr:MAG: hypothetical protein CUN55_05600 [Phototrophicales bacterium]
MAKKFSLLLVLLFLVACSTDGERSLSLFGAEPTQLDSSSAESVFTTFMDAWRDQDYETMYSLISPNARDTFTYENFVGIYEDVNTSLGLRDISWDLIAGPLVQGTSASVDYSVTFESDVIGTFIDPDPEVEDAITRTMYLITTSEGWRVAWSRMDIFPGWTSSARLRIQREMPQRGNIYDRNGNILVSQNGTVIGIYVIENRMQSVELCRNELARILRREQDDIQALFDRYLPDSEFLVGEISEETNSREFDVLNNICRYRAIPRTTRQYYGRVAPHLIGYIGQIPANELASYRAQGYPEDALVGRDGLELAFEEQLRGTIGKRLILESNTGIPIRTIANVDLVAGQSLYLTIDRDLQLGIQAMLAEAYDAAQATWTPSSKGAAVVVMNVNTGEVLAIASYPDYDPSVFNPDTPIFNVQDVIQGYRDDSRRPLLNRATRGSYPLGSVFKVFTTLAALDSGYWSADRLVTCTGEWNGDQWGAGQRTDWLLTGHGTLDMRGGLINSCNPYYWTMSVELNSVDPNLLPEYYQRMGFGVLTPFQGLLVDSGNIPSPDSVLRTENRQWSYADAANMVIGQGQVLVNPLQVVRATAMVANGGTLYDPYVVQRIEFLGQEPSFVAVPNGQPLGFDSEAIRVTQEAMCDVTRYTAQHAGTAAFIFDEGWYQQNGYRVLVCGKTGTAQTTDFTRPHAWFNAYAPAENPEIAVVVIVENSCEGSEVAAPMVRRIMELYFPQITTERYDWPEPIWFNGCTEIGPGSTG